MAKGNQNVKVLVALSGGVDSSVAAALLVKAGYSVTGAFMINYEGGDKVDNSCWLKDYRDAVRVAAHLGIPIVKWNFVKEYKQAVLDYLFAEYAAGRTPNPDVLCNTFIKFGAWQKKAEQLGFDYLATGHYARVKNGKLLEAKDKNKDQTYFLHQLSTAQLERVLFPVGGYTKPQVRALAIKFKLPTAQKAESMGICFVGEVPMQEFLEKRIPPKPGKIVMTNGTVIGEHQGLAFYTIGQRHFGAQGKAPQGVESHPIYVVAKRFNTNELVVGYDNDPLLYSRQINLEKVCFVSGQPAKFPLQCQVRLRHRQPLQAAKIVLTNGQFEARFTNALRAVTPGQFAVFYKNGVCLGGGVIK